MTADHDDIDPRIADRRDEVRRAHRHRRAVVLGVFAGVVALIGLAVGLTRSPVLDVDRVEVSGTDGDGRQAVGEVVASLAGTPMLDVDLDAVRAEVEGLPWVATVEVRRDWPATIVIDLTERRAVAVVSVAEDRWQLVDTGGRVIDEVGERPDGLLLLADVAPAEGPGAELQDAEGHLAVALAVDEDLRPRLEAVRTSEGGELLLDLAPEGRARLGGDDQLEEKLAALAVVLAQVDNRCLSIVDVRVPTAPTVTRVEACAAPASSTTTTTIWYDPTATTTPTTWSPSTTATTWYDPTATTLPATTLPATTIPATGAPITSSP